MRMESGAPAHCEESALSQLPSIERFGKRPWFFSRRLVPSPWSPLAGGGCQGPLSIC